MSSDESKASKDPKEPKNTTGSLTLAGTKDAKGRKDAKATKAHGMRQSTLPATVDAVTYDIIGAAMEVHTALGPGCLESSYRDALVAELRLRCRKCDVERRIRASYKGQELRPRRLDIVVDDCVLVEVKAATRLLPVHSAQVLSYLEATGYPVGLLLNFKVPHMRDGINRFVR